MIRSTVLATVLAVLPLTAACAKEKDTKETPAGKPTAQPTAPTAPAGPAPTDPGKTAPTGSDLAGAGGGEHGHQPMHGGKVATTTEGHLELVATPGGEFHLYLMDKSGAMRPAEGATAVVKLDSGTEVKLAPKEGHLAGQSAPIKAKHADAQVTVERAGKTETASFKLDFEDHGGAKKHGASGQDGTMKGDMGGMKHDD